MHSSVIVAERRERGDVPDGGGGVHDPSVLLLLEDGPRGVADLVGTTDVNVPDEVPLVVSHCEERLVTEDTSVANDGCDSTSVSLRSN